MSEPTSVSRRASAWWPALVGLDEVMDAVTAASVAIGRGAAPPSAASVHQLTGALLAVADAIESGTRPRAGGPLPADPQLEAVTDAVRSVLSMLTPGARGAGAGVANAGVANAGVANAGVANAVVANAGAAGAVTPASL
jgi:hypothetical protein